MKIILAPKAGFCFGVKRALDLAAATAQAGGQNVFSLGPLIHNPQVVAGLTNQGIRVINQLEEIPAEQTTPGAVLIRSHGAGPDVFREAEEKGLHIVDATCPFVKKAQQLARDLAGQGFQVVIVGERDHPEVSGILHWAGNHGTVVETPGEAAELKVADKVGLISQTTQPEENFRQIESVLKEKAKNLTVFNTICHATRERQEAAADLARQVQVMVVVGGRNSANTQKLARLCAATGTPTHHIETAPELRKEWFTGVTTVGLTAGASTPGWIIEEVKKSMEEVTGMEDEQKQLEDALEMKAVRRGETIKGTVVQVGEDEVMVDIGWKSEGVIPIRELSCCDIRSPKELFQVGDEIEATVIKIQEDEGRVLLSKRRADAEKSWDILKEAMENKADVIGLVSEVVKGGLLVDVGVQGFLPASLVERHFVDDLKPYIGQQVKVKVLEVKREARKVILSRKAVLEEEHQKNRAQVWDELEEGKTRKGIVRRLTNFGAFVDLGGVDGLLHVTEMAWFRVGHPSQILKENDEIEVYVLNIDREKEKVSLSLKQIMPNPWQTAAEKYAPGTVVQGKVVRIAPFGAFIELEPGIDALAHISQLSDKRIVSPSDVLSVGQEVSAKIIELDQEKRKIGLSLKELKKDEEKAETQDALKSIPADDEPALTLGDTLSEDFQKKLNEMGHESQD